MKECTYQVVLLVRGRLLCVFNVRCPYQTGGREAINLKTDIENGQ
jgi:hypothetical protein